MSATGSTGGEGGTPHADRLGMGGPATGTMTYGDERGRHEAGTGESGTSGARVAGTTSSTLPMPAQVAHRQSRPAGTQLVTEQGKTSIANTVVAKIAGVAAREISGVHDMGSGTTRMFGALRDKLPGTSETASTGRGVSVEVGERQAAIDLDIVADYGVAIIDLAEAIRSNVIRRVEAMTGLEVVEVNIEVNDVWLGEPAEPPRVQ